MPDKKLFVIPIFYLAISLFAIDSPRLPDMPKDPEESRDVRGDKENTEQKEYSITAKFCDGREITGKWKNKSSEFSFSHTKNRIQYQKTLKVTELAAITIVSWKLVPLKEKNNGIPYQVLPEEIKITSTDGSEFIKNSLKGSEFLDLAIENKNGKTRVFTWWMDLLEKDGKWHSGLPATKGDLRTDCHPDVIRQILFSHSQNLD